jgi:hypothetical protein
VIGEYICSGYIWAANVGWISLGNGNPANHIQYQNNAATDFGLNYVPDPATPGVVYLRGLAYGANIGWVNFDSTTNPFPGSIPLGMRPQLSLFTGTLSGYAYSANCGWINLNDINGKVQTDHVLMGVDSDGDGIADAFEYQYFGNLTTATGTSDADHDGISDKEEYLDGTSPMIVTDRLAITNFVKNGSDPSNRDITWTSNAARLYVIETKGDLFDMMWAPDPIYGTAFAPDASASSTIKTVMPGAAKKFYRVRAIRPLP